MNIAITLPETLWKKIVSGEKTIELRKGFPKDFDVNTDRVYVCLKGTRQVAGFFYVGSFDPFYAASICDFDFILAKISVPKQWVEDYVRNSSLVYLWNVREVHPFDEVCDRKCLCHLNTNPQSFVYIQ